MGPPEQRDQGPPRTGTEAAQNLCNGTDSLPRSRTCDLKGILKCRENTGKQKEIHCRNPCFVEDVECSDITEAADAADESPELDDCATDEAEVTVDNEPVETPSPVEALCAIEALKFFALSSGVLFS